MDRISNITPVLLAGGAGTRLWPVSRTDYPKQFLPLVGEYSTFQQTLMRVARSNSFAKPIVITNEDFRFLVQKQASAVNIPIEIVLEPARRDSAPAIAAAAALLDNRSKGALALVLAADHVILDDSAFVADVVAAIDAAEQGHIVTFGIPATSPKTDYGYIRRSDPVANSDRVHAVEAFVEKPNAETAARYIQEGLVWNSGNFLFRSDAMIDELRRFEPDIARAAAAAAAQASSDGPFLRLDPVTFQQSPAKSIDFAVMERTDKAAVINATFRWSDIGSWASVHEVANADENGNVLQGEVEVHGTRNAYVRSDRHFTAVLGLENVVVVTTDDAVLVASKDRLGDLKSLVQRMVAQGRREVKEHMRVYRPWGSYQDIDLGDRFRVKRIIVEPGAKLSLQKHLHRAEHWVVVRGTAEITCGRDVTIITENQSTYIPLGDNHRLANPGKIPLEIIEVQTGSYLGEDDIIRLEDIYARA